MDKMLEQQRAMNGENSKSKDEVVHKSYDERDNEKLSRSKMNDINKKKIEEARKRMAEKYGDDYDND
jgi:YidC/Oxa1 family membrane protein insertase